MYCGQCGKQIPDRASFCPACGAPAGSAPTDNTPADSAPAGNTPIGNTPTDSTPAGSTPTGSTPAGGTPTGSTPAGGGKKKGGPATRILILALAGLALVLLAVFVILPALFDRPLSVTREDSPGGSSGISHDWEEDYTTPSFSWESETPEQDQEEATSSGTRVLVSEPLDDAGYSPDGPAMQDLLYYGQSVLSFGDDSISDGYYARDFTGGTDDYWVLEDYADLLCSRFDFELVGQPYYQDYGDEKFFDFVLSYTGSGRLTGNSPTGTFSHTTGDVVIYGTIREGRLKGAIFYNVDLEVYDAGYSCQSDQADASYVGQSVTAGLYRMPDGSYETSDGRMSVTPGEAMVLSDGAERRYSARYVLDLDRDQQQIYVENSSGTAQLKFYFPSSTSLSTGDLFAQDYFIVESEYAQREDFQKQDQIPSYTWSTMFAILHDKGYVIPIRGMSGEMKRLNVRVMYWEEDVAAVFYACAQFDTAPYEMELLIAVPLGTNEVLENQPDDEFTLRVGQSLNITGPHEFDATTNRWAWEFIQNPSLATLEGDVAQTCTITARSAGDLRVRVTYRYSIKEPDVLTGIARTVQRSTTREYVVHIVS